MKVNNPSKFNTIKNLLIENPFVVIVRLTKHVTYALDHKSYMTTIVYIDIILICWLVYQFIQNHRETIAILKTLLISVKRSVLEEIDDLVELTELLKRLRENFSTICYF